MFYFYWKKISKKYNFSKRVYSNVHNDWCINFLKQKGEKHGNRWCCKKIQESIYLKKKEFLKPVQGFIVWDA